MKNLPENPLLGSLMYLRHCRGCQHKSGRLERFVDLSLTLPEARNVSNLPCARRKSFGTPRLVYSAIGGLTGGVAAAVLVANLARVVQPSCVLNLICVASVADAGLLRNTCVNMSSPYPQLVDGTHPCPLSCLSLSCVLRSPTS